MVQENTSGGANKPDGDKSAPTRRKERPTKVNWDDSQMQSSYANVINVITTREEFTLLFGTNATWNMGETRELTVRLSNRIVLTPFASKRLLTVLAARVQE